MDNKVRIGDQSDIAQRATDAEQGAAEAAAEVTMMQRRIRTFYMELSEVSFPETAPSWANEWLEWLLTGEVPRETLDPNAEVPGNAPEETAPEEAPAETPAETPAEPTA